MPSKITPIPAGGYWFLPGIAPYSSGVVSAQGFEIVHVTLLRAMPWLAGLTAVRQYLERAGRRVAAVLRLTNAYCS